MKSTSHCFISATSRLLLLLTLLSYSLGLIAQPFEGLTRLDAYETTYYSHGAERKALDIATRCDQVMSFYQDLIAFRPDVTIMVLSEADWSRFTSFPVYGMPHYIDNGTLIVAAEDNDFWKSFIPPVDQLPKELATQITSTYTQADGRLTMEPFFDLLAIHELGHAYHFQGGLNMQRKWMQELFANIFLHSYIAEKEPGLLPALTVFPQMVVTSTDKQTLAYTTLEELELYYNDIGQKHPNNYGWYQCRWHSAAADIYDLIRLKAMKDLWKALKEETVSLDDPSFAAFLSKNVHPCVADVQLRWNE